jgi:predicted negative regulator of RcsB-dependent stress response
LSDFASVINLGQDKTGKGLGFLGQGDAYKGIGDIDAALNAYTRAIASDEKAV